MIDFRFGNNIELINTIDDNSIDLVITSPPYFNTAHKYQRVSLDLKSIRTM